MEKNEPHFSSYAALERIIREYPNKEAFVFCDRSSGQLELQRWTYAQIEQGIYSGGVVDSCFLVYSTHASGVFVCRGIFV